MKTRVQAQHLQPGDIVGSGEKVISVSAGVRTPSGKVDIKLVKYQNSDHEYFRTAQWGKYTMINVVRGSLK